VIDADYRSEVGVILVNHGRAPVRLERGMRVAQLVVVPFVRVEITEVQDLDATPRGAAGFGSTGAG
jgi:dUTP pyrophosphatase